MTTICAAGEGRVSSAMPARPPSIGPPSLPPWPPSPSCPPSHLAEPVGVEAVEGQGHDAHAPQRIRRQPRGRLRQLHPALLPEGPGHDWRGMWGEGSRAGRREGRREPAACFGDDGTARKWRWRHAVSTRVSPHSACTRCDSLGPHTLRQAKKTAMKATLTAGMALLSPRPALSMSHLRPGPRPGGRAVWGAGRRISRVQRRRRPWRQTRRRSLLAPLPPTPPAYRRSLLAPPTSPATHPTLT